MFYGTCLFSFLARPMHRLNFDLFQIFRAKFWPFLNFEGFPHGRAESAVFYRTNHVVRLGLVATMWWGLVWLQRFDFIGENFDPHQCWTKPLWPNICEYCCYFSWILMWYMSGFWTKRNKLKTTHHRFFHLVARASWETWGFSVWAIFWPNFVLLCRNIQKHMQEVTFVPAPRRTACGC